MLNLLPALLIGGPPHAGKSVLAYSLSQALRSRNVPHYLLRAAPDGEGDWSHEMDPRRVHAIRFKGAWSPAWVHVTCRDVAQRPMPLLVDVGGKPTPEQMTIFDQCTAAILLTPDDEQRNLWRAIVQARGLPILADLRSELHGENRLHENDGTTSGTISGVLSGLERGQRASGAAFEALVERLARLFDVARDAIERWHMATAPQNATVVHFDQLAQAMYPQDPKHHFRENDIKAILAHIPADEPIAAYGRIPAWLATALGARRELVYQFDVRLGWVRTPRFVMSMSMSTAMGRADEPLPANNAWLAFRARALGQHRWQLDASKVEYYLDYSALDGLRVPYLPPEAHVTVNGPHTPRGSLPLWVFAALGRAYRSCASVRAVQAH